MKNPLPVIEHAIVDAFKFIGKAEHVLATAIQHQPELKAAVTTLVQKVEIIGVDTMQSIGERGLDPTADLKTVMAIADLGRFLSSTFIPLVEKLYSEIKVEVIAEPAD